MKAVGFCHKLTLSYAALFAVVLVAIGGTLYYAMNSRLDRVVNERLEDLSAGLWAHAKIRGGLPTLNTADYFVSTAARWFQLYDAENGRLLVQSQDLEPVNSILSTDEVMRRYKEPEPEFDELVITGTKFRFRSAVFYAEANHPYVLRVGIPLVQVEGARLALIRLLLILSLPGVLVSAMAGWWMARNALSPVEELRTAAYQIGISQLNRRLPVRGTGDELDALATTFNEVFARLEEAVSNLKQFTDGISHELRTPLATLQGGFEMVLMWPDLPEKCRFALASQSEELEKLSGLVHRLLELAQAESGEIQLTKQELDLSALLRSLTQQMEPLAASQRLFLHVDCPRSIHVLGDPQWLERVFINLLDNAIKFTPEGGNVSVAAGLREDYVAIEVTDTGIGIPQRAIPHLFERFYRVDASRSKQVEGTGLGLAIVKWIVEAHDGRIDVKSQPGIGSCFTVLLPAAVPAGIGEGFPQASGAVLNDVRKE